MIFILSAQYVGESLRSEVGDLPISFVPLANRRLYSLQVETLRAAYPTRSIVMTLPKDFKVSEIEQNWLKNNEVVLLTFESGVSYGLELSEALRNHGKNYENVTFLFGSSLPLEIPILPDMLALFETDLEPGFPVESYGNESDLIWAGLFNVSDSAYLAECLELEFNDCVRAIKRYSFTHKLEHTKIERCCILTNSTSYFHARSTFTTERAFNRLKIEQNVLRKFSSKREKIVSESRWFKNTPSSLRRYIPQYLGEGLDNNEYYYSIEYLGATPLNESFVFGRQTILFWDRVFDKILIFLHDARSTYKMPCAMGARNKALFVRKAQVRLEEFILQTGFDANSSVILNGVSLPSLSQILEESSAFLTKLEDVPAFLHGDLCLSNILYDSRMSIIKLIDPRGMDEDGKGMLFGSQLYDAAKLAHSIIGLYDHIMAGQFALSVDGLNFNFKIFTGDGVEEIQAAFRRHIFVPGIPSLAIDKTLPLLFIGMLPLHADSANRQKALLANVFRLYAQNFTKKYN